MPKDSENSGLVRRLVVADDFTEDDFFSRAYHRDWLWWNTIEESDDGPREAVFKAADQETQIHFVTDSFLDTRFLHIEGPNAEAEYEQAKQHIPNLSDDEVASSARNHDDSDHRAVAVLDLAAIANQLPHEQVVDILRAAAQAETSDVGRNALVAIGYLGWEALRPIVETVNSNDSDPEIRAMAKTLLAALDAG